MAGSLRTDSALILPEPEAAPVRVSLQRSANETRVNDRCKPAELRAPDLQSAIPR